MLIRVMHCLAQQQLAFRQLDHGLGFVISTRICVNPQTHQRLDLSVGQCSAFAVRTAAYSA
jgi:hypothetical protein